MIREAKSLNDVARNETRADDDAKMDSGLPRDSENSSPDSESTPGIDILGIEVATLNRRRYAGKII